MCLKYLKPRVPRGPGLGLGPATAPPGVSPLAEGSLGRTRCPGTWGRGCHGAHGAGDAVGPMAVPVRWASSLHPTQGSGWLVPGAAVPVGGPRSRRVLQEWAKPGLGSVLAGGEQRFCHPSPKGGSAERCWLQPRSRVMATHAGHGGESRSARQPRAARASHPPHVPGSVTCGRPLDFGHTFNARTHQTEAFPGYSCFCLKG